ncbi:PepSY domain-containing protein [Micrococcoides hystricis]|uniref:PepSY domain-containing protein n=1 Tax=Micrococcoides hystricis TaxID=1572761 RepID=A0ABV6P827_9MICC
MTKPQTAITSTPPKKLAKVLGLIAAAALALSACGQSNPSDQHGDRVPEEQQATSGEETNTAEIVERFEDVIATATEEVPNSAPLSYEYEDGGSKYDLEMVAAEHVVHELTIEPDGTTIREHEETDPLDGDDLDEFLEATIGMEEAVTKAREQAPKDSAVEDVELKTEEDVLVWEIVFKQEANAKHQVRVDAKTGDIVPSDPRLG